MDELTTRRRMMTAEGLIDTSPKIVLWDYNLPTRSGDPIPQNGYCITAMYPYEPSTESRYLVTCGCWRIHTYIDGAFCDWWNWNDSDGHSRKSVNANSNGIQLALNKNKVDISYAYIRETGQILFAGKDSRYYGYRNISEVPEGSAS